MRTYVDYVKPDRLGVSFPPDARPSLTPNHIDGPLVTFSDGQMHWLNLWECLLLCFGLTDAEKLQRKRRPNLTRLLQL